MAVERYIEHLEGDEATNLYEMVLEEIEEPLLRAVMKYTNNNQSKASLWLGLSRGTTRKKLEKYELVSESDELV
jgi:Fis family transcriptional regulator